MAKSRKKSTRSSKPSVKVRDLRPNKNPKGGAAIKESIHFKYDALINK